MGARVRNGPALVYANVGVDEDVEITLVMERDEGAAIHLGRRGPDVIMEFADADSLERLAVVATEGARLLRERISRVTG